jgi:ribosomal protein L37E
LIEDNEDFNSHKSYCISCGVEIIIVRTRIVTESLRIMKDGTLAKKSHKTDRVGEGTESHNAHCERCGEDYEFKESHGIYTILGKCY